MLEHLVVVRTHAGPARLALDQQVVEERPPAGRVALDEGEVLRGEEHRRHRAEDLAWPGQRRPVEAGPVRTAGVELELDERLAPVAHDDPADDRAFGPNRTKGWSLATRWLESVAR